MPKMIPKADRAHRLTDRELRKLEERIAKSYIQAYDGIAEKADKYFNQFAKLDKEMAQKVKDKKITFGQYREWRKNKMLIGKRWNNMLDVIGKDMLNAEKIAMGYVNDTKLDVYAINANFATYQIEHDSRIDTSFTLYNKDTVKMLIKENPRLLPNYKPNEEKLLLWNKQHINSVITQAVLQGKSIPDVAKSLEKVTDMDSRAAVRNARTAVTCAQNKARFDSYERAEELGIKMKKVWLATLDDRTRESHVDLDGEEVDINEKFSNGLMFPADPDGEPSEVYNCFIPETNIGVDSKIIRSYKHRYEGEVISIKSSMGVNFTCTPNHPILTDRGWVKAKFLNEGDNLIVTRCIDNEVARRNPYINHAFPRIDTIHELFCIFGGKRTSGMRVNFHGDIPTSEVEIVTQKGFLWSDVYTCIRKCINKFLFKDTNISFLCKCPFVEHFGRVVHTTFSNISGVCKSFSIFHRCLSHANIHGLGTITDSNVIFGKNTLNNLPTNVVLPSEIKNGLASKIFIDDIVSVKRSYFTGHVFNLQTDDNYYFVNSSISKNDDNSNGIMAIAHNCRCRMITQIDKYRTDWSDLKNRNNDKLGGMSYDEWKSTHGKKRGDD